MDQTTTRHYLEEVRWNADGLVPAIARDWNTGKVLMMAWMNADSLRCTVDEGRAVYWSRSRQALWRKGESSGNTQQVKSLRLDCDGDTLLLEVEQVGGMACHTGREHCFYRELIDGKWQTVEAVLKDPEEIYATKR
ncbi:phosphoribosyl-AMP cyclohydrolase [Congregibacter litoralis]|uniref:Phosphoribosyl-AMP cyclohydrolase n=1 Tax=Congregibacter litoralis KT71 TaxID=314285 RepID=A4A8N0_9GAMM|nr:phosphoribosyl-AMP cyclohydrolase [Congregibacter litoralis]EAQ97422.1 phosphoribosyl-AMP cyclohydrolase [Congregibacter litoralis KT71]